MEELRYIIYEVQTGYVDGWYYNADDAVEAYKLWKCRRSNYHHVIHAVLEGEERYLDDSEMLNRHYDYDERHVSYAPIGEKCNILEFKLD